MRRWVFIASCVVVARLGAPLLGMAPPVVMNVNPVNPLDVGRQMAFDGPAGYYGRYDATMSVEQLRTQIGGILDMSRLPGMDDWAWHGAVEDQLVNFGQRLPRAVPLLWQAAETRKGFEQDVLQVAAFRLENPGINPREAVAQWAQRQPGASREPGKQPRVMRVMGLRNLFPHHLFYTVEARIGGRVMRTVLAVAADSKVQAVSDDAALARFMRVELPPLNSDAARDQAAETAALLALARYGNVYQREQVVAAPEPLTWTGDNAGQAVKTRVTFDDGGRVAKVSVVVDKVAQPEAAPVLAPNPAAPPAMPD